MTLKARCSKTRHRFSDIVRNSGGCRIVPVLAFFLFSASTARSELRLVETTPIHDGDFTTAHGPILLTFNHPIRLDSFSNSVDAPTLRLTPSAGAGGSTVSWSVLLSEDRLTALCTPSPPLLVGQTYQLFVSDRDEPYPVREDNTYRTALSIADVPNPFLFRVVDTIPPAFIGVQPFNGEREAPINALVGFLATEPLNPASVRLTLNGVTIPSVPLDGGRRWIASPPLEPSRMYQATAYAEDFGKNQLQTLSWTFETSAISEPDQFPPRLIATDPADGAIDVQPDIRPVFRFSEPLLEMTFQATLRRCGLAEPIPFPKPVFSMDRTFVTLVLPPLETGPTCYDLRAAGEDRAGQPLLLTAPLGDGIRFTTVDRTPPRLIAAGPAMGTVIDPVIGPDITLEFNEAIALGNPIAPVITLAYLSGMPPPLLDPADAESLGDGKWMVTASSDPNRRSFVLRVLPIPGDATGCRYRHGDTLTLRLENARDPSGNRLEEGTIPSYWSVSVKDNRPAVLLETSPSPNDVTALDAPVTLRFNRRMDPSSLEFAAEGDWSSCSTLKRIGSMTEPPLWKANSTAWSPDRSMVVLRHAPFPESAPGTLSTHELVLIRALDSNLVPMVLPESGTMMTWRTARRPRLASVGYVAPLSYKTDLTVDGFLVAPLDASRTVESPYPWREGRPALPRNTRLRVRFDPSLSTAGAPGTEAAVVGTPEPPGAVPTVVVSMEESGDALVAFDTPLPATASSLLRMPDGSLSPAPPLLSLRFIEGVSIHGDPIAEQPIPLHVIDLNPPMFQVEFLADPAGGVWETLEGAIVPPDAPWRVAATEALLDGDSVLVERVNGLPDPSLAGPVLSERMDGGGGAGSIVEIRWREPLAECRMAMPGEDHVDSTVRVCVMDRALPPNVTEKEIGFVFRVPPRPLAGDLDRDGDLDETDLLRIITAWMSRQEFTADDLLAIDVTPPGGDGRFGATDLNAILRRFASIP